MKVPVPLGRSKHHVPPKKPDKQPRIIVVDDRHHKAYHLLFGNAKSFEDACHILKRDWWTLIPTEDLEPSDFIAL